ncbi:MAG TPA: hypothetical protein VEZ90_10765 [Blastocatellia bacterium]|nr:hypothetical protein [Blastocatellia bacterium]
MTDPKRHSAAASRALRSGRKTASSRQVFGPLADTDDRESAGSEWGLDGWHLIEKRYDSVLARRWRV